MTSRIIAPLLALSLPTLAFAERGLIERHIERTLPATGIGTLRIDHQEGDVRIITGPEGEIRISARQHFPGAGTEARADAISKDLVFQIDAVADGVSLQARHPRGEGSLARFRDLPVKTDWHVTLPEAWSVEVAATRESDVAIEHLRGSITVRVAEGDIDILGVRSPISVRTSDGDITIVALPADVFDFVAVAPRGEVDGRKLRGLAVTTGEQEGNRLSGIVGNVVTGSPRLDLHAAKGDIDLETR